MVREITHVSCKQVLSKPVIDILMLFIIIIIACYVRMGRWINFSKPQVFNKVEIIKCTTQLN